MTSLYNNRMKLDEFHKLEQYTSFEVGIRGKLQILSLVLQEIVGRNLGSNEVFVACVA